MKELLYHSTFLADVLSRSASFKMSCISFLSCSLLISAMAGLKSGNKQFHISLFLNGNDDDNACNEKGLSNWTFGKHYFWNIGFQTQHYTHKLFSWPAWVKDSAIYFSATCAGRGQCAEPKMDFSRTLCTTTTSIIFSGLFCPFNVLRAWLF